MRIGGLMREGLLPDPMLGTLSSHGLDLGFYNVPWSWVVLAVVIAVGLLLIRTAITLVKVAIIVAIALALYLGVSLVMDHFF
jgi:hypothetical protein